jgi:GTP-dependent phosphoenolpyruvate carboxykinase
VRYWAELTGAARIQVVSASDDARLLGEALADGEILPAGEGRYYSRSYVKDTARSEERTVVATSNPADKGVYNNWRPAGEMRPLVEEHMRGASAGKTMYVVPYLMAPAGSPLERYAAGVELTDCRTVALHMIRMARVGVRYIDDLADPNSFVRAVHVTGDLEKLGQGTPGDQRCFVTIADKRTILHFGSSYGGNALLGKIAHGLRQAAYDGWASGEFLAEQFMLIGITDKLTGKRYHVCGGFPSASGKTNLAMMLAPGALGGRYRVDFYGDDIAWLRVDPDDDVRNALGNNAPIGTAVSATPSLNSSKGCTRAPDGRMTWQTFGGPGLTRRGYARSGSSDTTRRDRWAPEYLWARRPAITGGSVHHVQAVSSRATRLPRLAARPRGALLLLHPLLRCPARKVPLPSGKGP